MVYQPIMRRIIITIFTLIIIFSSYSITGDLPTAQTPPSQVMNEIILPQDSSYVTYLGEDIFNFDNEIPISSIGPNPLTPGFCVVVNSTIYPSIKVSLEQYSQDVNASGYSTKIVIGTWPTIRQVRAILRGEWQNNGTVAAVLIGNFSIPWYIHGGETFPIDLYFMDLDGNWLDSNKDGVMDGHTGNVAADIVFGRLPAYILSADEAQLLNTYFTKNHLYRTGQLKLPNKNLVYVDDDWFGSAEGWKNDAELNYENVTLVKNGVTTCEADYKQRLVQDYEFIEVHCHADHLPTRHHFKVGGSFEPGEVNSTDIRNIDPHTFFSILFTCGSLNYSAQDFLAGWYTFADSYGLASISSSKVGGMLNYNQFYEPLSDDKTIGEAFKDWFVLNAESSRSWFYGMGLIGDPLLTPNQYDLEAGDITFSKLNPYEGETVYVHTNIHNSLDNCSKVEVKLYDGDPAGAGILIDTKVVNFGWDTNLELNFSWQVTVGDHDIWVVVDDGNDVAEINETNNLNFETINVYQLPQVELVPGNAVVYTYDNINFECSIFGGFGNIEGYYFEFGDGNNSGWLTENCTIFNYTDNGIYNAQLTIIDNNGYNAYSPPVQITVRNRNPVAVLETDLTGEAFEVMTGEPVHFNGSKSYDIDGMILSYFWDFGDDETIYGITAEHSYVEDGLYTVKLYIMDDDSGSHEVTVTITVTNRLPVAVIEHDQNAVLTNTILTFSGEQSYDIDGQLDSYHWEFGDGVTSIYKTPQHKYADDGNYTVTLKVIDNDGDEGLATCNIEVLNRAPTAAITSSAFVVYTNVNIFFNATAADTDGTVNETHWAFGDGEAADGLAVSHAFGDDGEYQVNFTVLDDDGAYGMATLTIIVKNAAPQPQFEISPIAGNTTTTFTFNSSSYDTDGKITNYTWEFGDGNVSYGPTATHEYASPGNYTVILRLWDDDGELAEISEYIVVEKAPLIKPPKPPEPEPEDESNRSRTRDEEPDFSVELMAIGIIIVIIVIIILALFFILFRRKQRDGAERYPPMQEGSLGSPQAVSGERSDQPEDPKPEIEWDDEQDEERFY